MVTGFTTALTNNTDNLKKLYEQDKNKKSGQELLIPYNATTGKGVPQEAINWYRDFHKVHHYIGKAAVAPYNNILTLGKDSNGAATQVDYQALAIPLTGRGIVIDCAGMCYRYLFVDDPKGKESFKKEVPVFDDHTPQGWYEWNVKILCLVYERCMWFPNYFIQRKEQGTKGFICADQVNEPMADIPSTVEELLPPKYFVYCLYST